MAEEIKKVISIDTGKGITSLKDYKKHIDELRGSLLQLDKDSEEYKATEEEIAKETDKLNEVLKAGKKQVEDLDGSYNQLNKQLIEAKKQWKALSEEERNGDVGANLLKNIQSLDGQLKELDGSIGQYQRNVGNYGGAFKDAFDKAKVGLTSAVPAVGKFRAALTALAANPIGAIISAIAIAIMAVIKAMKKSEKQFAAFKQATAALQPIMDALQNALSAVVNILIKLAETTEKIVKFVLKKIADSLSSLGFDEWAGKIQGALDKMEEYKNLQTEEDAIVEKRRQTARKTAELDRDISELRAKIADKEHYDNKQRLAFINEWEAKEKEKASLQKKLAEDEYALIKKRNSLTESSTDDLDAENEAYIKVIEATTTYNEKMRDITKQKQQFLGVSEKTTASTKEETEEQKKLRKELEAQEEARKKRLEDAEDIEKRLEELDKTEYDKFKEKYTKEKAILEEFGKDTERLTKEYNDNIAKLTGEDVNVSLNSDFEGLDKAAEQAKFMADIEVENERDKAERIYEIDKKLYEDKIALLQDELVDFRGTEEQKKALEEELSNFQLGLSNLTLERSKNLKEQQIKDEEDLTKTKKALQQTLLSSTASIFGAIAEMSEEGSEQQKTFQIMETTINTLSGAIGAFTQASSSYPPPYGQIIGAATAAAVVASGIAQISKIKSTTKNNTSSLSGSMAASIPNVGVNPLLNEQQDIQNLTSLNVNQDNSQQQSQRVYVVESDISESQNNRKVKVENSTF